MAFDWQIWGPVGVSIGGAVAADAFPKHKIAILGATALTAFGFYEMSRKKAEAAEAMTPATRIGATALLPPRYSPRIFPTNTSRPGFSAPVVAALQQRFAAAVARQQWGEVARLGTIFEKYGIPRTAAEAARPRVAIGAAFPPATVIALQSRLAEARATGNTAEVNRILGIFQRYGISLAPPGSEPGAYAEVGDVVQIPYRSGDVVANHVRVDAIQNGTIRGVVGSAIHANGQATSWWNDAARMAASARVPLVVPLARVEHVWRRGTLVI